MKRGAKGRRVRVTGLRLAGTMFCALAGGLVLSRPALLLSAQGTLARIPTAELTDTQGMVSIRRSGALRWQRGSSGDALAPGDVLRCDARGANAAALRLPGCATVTAGPGSRIEIVDTTTLRVARGELEIVPVPRQTLTLRAGDEEHAVRERSLVRVAAGELTRLDASPPWLKGFQGAVANESLGSLIANVDGRDVALSVGYHRVRVIVRDQIARVTVEESFVNHTNGVLEGVFHFPLPAGASVSGFGMWIGNELVMADVVERQRAREIYETILRERRDPGLLEWEGGNVFKARVYPIPGGGEKRITISYTQVLPAREGRFRFTYPLRSDLLRQHPLRQLDIGVRIYSALPLTDVVCRSHEARVQRTEHSALVDFHAQEFTPERDFAVDITAADSAGGAFIPHDRAGDGYFMMLITPPDEIARHAPQTDAEPLDLIVLADTSGSMRTPNCDLRNAFLSALLTSLSEKDRFRLAVCDVDCRWLQEEPAQATESEVGTALDALAEIHPLGWTDLDAAFETVLKTAGPRTQVIYVGDGVPTSGDADPNALTNRLKRMLAESRAEFHTVAVGSAFEAPVLEGIAGAGRGSFRQAPDRDQALAAAWDLLRELTSPALRDLTVTFNNIRTARVYPADLPNLPAGSQQVVVGRYLVTEEPLKGQATVTGRLGNRQVSWRIPISAPGAYESTSFIPRLWARRHLDHLLSEAPTEQVVADIIALSADFQIMTPYTSFLVLETDADRERFGVKRTFRMRDGERFFAEGQDAVNTALARQAMQRAEGWRRDIRQNVLRTFGRLGAEFPLDAQTAAARLAEVHWKWQDPATHQFKAVYDSSIAPVDGRAFRDAAAPGSMGEAMGMGGGESGSDLGANRFLDVDGNGLSNLYGFDDDEERTRRPEAELKEEAEGWSVDAWEAARSGIPPSAPPPALSYAREPAMNFEMADMGGTVSREVRGLVDFRGASYRTRPAAVYDPLQGGRSLRLNYSATAGFAAQTAAAVPETGSVPLMTLMMQPVFPGLGPFREPVASEGTWSTEALALSRSLLKHGRLAASGAGVRFLVESESLDAQSGRISGRSGSELLLTGSGWIHRTGGFGDAPVLTWCWDGQHGVLSTSFGCGTEQDAATNQHAYPPAPLQDYAWQPLHAGFSSVSPEIAAGEDGTVHLTVDYSESRPPNTSVFVIDPKRHVLLKYETYWDGELRSTVSFSDFVQAAGCWWPTVQTRTGVDGKPIWRIRLTVTEVTADGAAAHAATMLAPRTKALILHPEEFPTFYQAAKRLAAGEATPEDCVVTLAAAQSRQQHDRALAVADTLLALRPELRGLHWLRAWVQANGADKEASRTWTEQEAKTIAATPDDDDLWLANLLLGAYIRGLEANEKLDLLDLLAPVYRRQPDWLHGEQTVSRHRIEFLQQASRNVEALDLRRQLAAMRPDDLSAQLDYARNLAQVSDWDRGLAVMRQLLGIETWIEAQKIQIAGAIADLLRQRRRHEETAEFIAGFLGDARYPGDNAAKGLWHRLLEALLRLDREAEAHALCRGLLDAAVDPAVPSQARDLALQVARPIITRQQLITRQQPYDLFRDTRHRVLDTWFEPIAQTIRKAVENELELRQLTGFVIQEFNTSDEWKALRPVLLEQVLNRGGSMSAQALQSTVELLRAATPPLEPEEWSRVADVLISRWSTDRDRQQRQQIEYLVDDACRRAEQIETWLQALRAAAENAAPGERDRLLGQCFNLRISREWSPDAETDAFKLLNRLGEALEEEPRRTFRVMALLDIADWMYRAQLRDRFASIPPPHESSRTETRRLRSEALQRAAATTAERLADRLSDVPAELHPWLHLVRLQFRCRAGESPNDLAGDCVELLGPSAPQLTDLESAADFAFLLRSLRTLEFLATREEADARWAEQILTYLREAVTSEPDAELWRDHLIQMLIALDRVPELERLLEEWIAGEQDRPAWRITLAWLAAEQGRLQAAVDHVVPLMGLQYLDAATAHGLADWHRALGDEEKHDRTKLYAYEQAQPYVVEQMLNRLMQPLLQNQESATEIPAEAFLMIRSVAKRGRPPYQLRSYYEHTRDSRLLICLADCCLNQTARGIYPVLGLMRDVMDKVHEEAAVDAVTDRVTELRDRALTAVDRRALDLIEAAAQTRAARLRDRPEPHVLRARAAMKRAFDHEWSAGEPRLMAEYLQQLGKLEAEALAQEQVRQLYALMAIESAPRADRWHTAYSLAHTLGLYARTDEPLTVLESVLAELRDAHGGRLPNQGNSLFNLYIDVLRHAQQFRRAEMAIREELVRPFSSEQETRLLDWLANVYIAAVQAGGDCRLGTGVELYRSVRAELDSILVTPLDVQPLKTMVDHACRLFRIAKTKFPNAGVPEDAVRFGENIMPQVLTRLYVEPYTYSNAIDNVSRMLLEVAGPRPALTFLVRCFEADARRDGEVDRERFWSNCADELGRCLQALDFKPGELEERLVAILLNHLRASLRYGQRSLYVLSKRNGFFWEAKADVFEQTARDVAADNPGRPEVLHQVGRYLHEDLKRTSAAVDVLLPAWKEDRLDEQDAFLLAQCLHALERFEESVPVLNRLIEEAPDTVVYRITLMWARFKMDQRDLLKGCFQAAEQHFREGHLWAESNASALAEACLRTELYDDAVRLYNELIPQRQREHPRGGANDYTLSQYHTNLASAYAGLGKTAEAVDAACGAVVGWGNDQGHRQGALSTLVNILRNANDLEQFAAEFSADLAARGVENPVVRRALGVAFLQRKEFDGAIRHLEAATSAQPDDTRSWEQLVQAYDRKGNTSGAVDALARAVQYAPRELDLYRQLADHLALNAEMFQARRAYLSMIEAMPTETEGHTKLAEIRQQQQRMNEAVFHWRRVADLRPLEPTGLLRLADAQIRARQFDDARATVRQLEQTAWPERFGSVEASCTNFRKRLEQADQ